jgi:hypothetical protein
MQSDRMPDEDLLASARDLFSRTFGLKDPTKMVPSDLVAYQMLREKLARRGYEEHLSVQWVLIFPSTSRELGQTTEADSNNGHHTAAPRRDPDRLFPLKRGEGVAAALFFDGASQPSLAPLSTDKWDETDRQVVLRWLTAFAQISVASGTVPNFRSISEMSDAEYERHLPEEDA